MVTTGASSGDMCSTQSLLPTRSVRTAGDSLAGKPTSNSITLQRSRIIRSDGSIQLMFSRSAVRVTPSERIVGSERTGSRHADQEGG